MAEWQVSGRSSTRASATRRTSSTSATARRRRRPAPLPDRAPGGSRRQRGLRLAWTVDTHSHADYVTGSPALAADGAITFIAPAASQARDAAPRRCTTRNGSTLAAGVDAAGDRDARPHPDHLAYLLERRRRAGGAVHRRLADGRRRRPHRPARPGAGRAAGARDVPLAAPPRRLPDDLAVYPTHGAGSFCSAPGGAERTTTLGRERATNPLLRDRRRGRVRRAAARRVRLVPDLLRRLPELNRRGPRLYAQLPQLDRLDVDTVGPSRRRRRADRRRPTDRRLRRRAHPRLDVERAATGVRQLARLARRPRPTDRRSSPTTTRTATSSSASASTSATSNIVGELDGGIDAWRAAGRPITGDPARRPGRRSSAR